MIKIATSTIDLLISMTNLIKIVTSAPQRHLRSTTIETDVIETSRDATASLMRRDDQMTENIPAIDQENAALKAIVPEETNRS
jgi:hypothetical protein